MNKGIIFDFDGVICDSVNVKTEAFKLMYNEYGKEVVEKVEKYHNLHGGISRYEKFRYFHKEFLGIKLNEDEVFKMAEVFSSIVLQKVIDSDYIPGIIEFIKSRFKNTDLFICTGTPETEILEILESKKIKKYFTGIYGSPKNKVEIINLIMNNCKIKRDQLEFYGDAMTDYNAAKVTQIKFIGLLNSITSFPKGTNVIKDFF